MLSVSRNIVLIEIMLPVPVSRKIALKQIMPPVQSVPENFPKCQLASRLRSEKREQHFLELTAYLNVN